MGERPSPSFRGRGFSRSSLRLSFSGDTRLRSRFLTAKKEEEQIEAMLLFVLHKLSASKQIQEILVRRIANQDWTGAFLWEGFVPAAVGGIDVGAYVCRLIREEGGDKAERRWCSLSVDELTRTAKELLKRVSSEDREETTEEQRLFSDWVGKVILLIENGGDSTTP